MGPLGLLELFLSLCKSSCNLVTLDSIQPSSLEVNIRYEERPCFGKQFEIRVSYNQSHFEFFGACVLFGIILGRLEPFWASWSQFMLFAAT